MVATVVASVIAIVVLTVSGPHRIAPGEAVSILHDPDVHRNHRIPSLSVMRRYDNLTASARLLVSAMATELGVADRG